MFATKKILVLSPHPDDGELGAGATVAKMLEQKVELHWAVFSWAEESNVGENMESEFRNSMKKLGVPTGNLHPFEFPVRHFPEKRQEILERMIELRKRLEPEVVLVPCSLDIHQDHATVASEAVRAFKHTTLLGFEEPWNMTETRLSLFVKIEEKHLQKKIEAIEQYASQKKKRTYANAEYWKSLAIIRGQQINERYAEAFEVLRMVVR